VAWSQTSQQFSWWQSLASHTKQYQYRSPSTLGHCLNSLTWKKLTVITRRLMRPNNADWVTTRATCNEIQICFSHKDATVGNCKNSGTGSSRRHLNLHHKSSYYHCYSFFYRETTDNIRALTVWNTDIILYGLSDILSDLNGTTNPNLEDHIKSDCHSH